MRSVSTKYNIVMMYSCPRQSFYISIYIIYLYTACSHNIAHAIVKTITTRDDDDLKSLIRNVSLTFLHANYLGT